MRTISPPRLSTQRYFSWTVYHEEPLFWQEQVLPKELLSSLSHQASENHVSFVKPLLLPISSSILTSAWDNWMSLYRHPVPFSKLKHSVRRDCVIGVLSHYAHRMTGSGSMPMQ